MRLKSLLAAAVLSASLVGCASSSLVVGTRRPPIAPEQVRIYLDPPARYEKVALLSAVSNFSWAITDQGKTNKVADRLRAEAAAVGANGVLLQGLVDQQSGSIGSGQAWGNGYSAFAFGTSTAVYMKKGTGVAIYVPDEAEAGPIWEERSAAAPARPVSPPPPGGSTQPYEPDPAKRCDACERIRP
jgi:hypothetical protein